MRWSDRYALDRLEDASAVREMLYISRPPREFLLCRRPPSLPSRTWSSIYKVGRWIGDSGLDLGEFLSDLRSILGPGALRRVGRKVLDDDCLGLAGQLAYFVLLSLFPFLMSLVAIGGLAINDPESVLETLAERMSGFLSADAAELLVEEALNRILRSIVRVFIGKGVEPNAKGYFHKPT
jgi:hypothetical protein